MGCKTRNYKVAPFGPVLPQFWAQPCWALVTERSNGAALYVPMPKLFFHLRDNEGAIPDDEGMVLRELEAAKA